MNKLTLISLSAAVIVVYSSNVSASWSKKSWSKRNWYDRDWNPYQVWCPRYWIKEMVNIFDDDYPDGRYYLPHNINYIPFNGYRPYTAGYYPYSRAFYPPVFMAP